MASPIEDTGTGQDTKSSSAHQASRTATEIRLYELRQLVLATELQAFLQSQSQEPDLFTVFDKSVLTKVIAQAGRADLREAKRFAVGLTFQSKGLDVHKKPRPEIPSYPAVWDTDPRSLGDLNKFRTYFQEEYATAFGLEVPVSPSDFELLKDCL